MKPLSEIINIKNAKETDFLQRQGVTAMDVGYKYVGGKKTNELSIRVFVAEKKDVPDNERIPKTIQGIKTDVIQRRFKLNQFGAMMSVTALRPMVDSTKYDPIRGGVSIGPCRSVHLAPPDVPANEEGNYIFTGTAGCIVKDNVSGKQMMLSNYHVMCVDTNWTVGDTIAQPSLVDGGLCPRDVVGTVTRSSLGGQVDCAVAEITARSGNCEIQDIGNINGTAVAAVGMAVRKRGRTTGLTHGTVDSVSLSVNVPYIGLGIVTLTNQIGIEVDPTQSAAFGLGGDSGSVVVNNNVEVVGLYFAGNEEEKDANGNVITREGVYGVANPFAAVLTALNVSLCLPQGQPRCWIHSPQPIQCFPYSPLPYRPQCWPYNPLQFYPPRCSPNNASPFFMCGYGTVRPYVGPCGLSTVRPILGPCGPANVRPLIDRPDPIIPPEGPISPTLPQPGQPFPSYDPSTGYGYDPYAFYDYGNWGGQYWPGFDPWYGFGG